MPNIPESGNSFMFLMKSTELPLPQVKLGPNSASSSTDCLSLKILRSNKDRSMAIKGKESCSSMIGIVDEAKDNSAEINKPRKFSQKLMINNVQANNNAAIVSDAINF